MNFDHLIIIEGEGDRFFDFPTDIDRLQQDRWQELTPEGRNPINRFVRATRVFFRHSLPIEKAPELLTTRDKLRFLRTSFPLLRTMNAWKKVTLRDFTRRLRNPFFPAKPFPRRGPCSPKK